MQIQRTIPLIIERDGDLLALVSEYNRYQRSISQIAFNDGAPMAPVPLHKAVYHTLPSTLPSQMKCSAIRNVAGAYASAKRNKRPAERPFAFRRKAALFLYNKDFSFPRDGKLSISTSVGRKRLEYRVPAFAQSDFDNAVSRDAIVVTGDLKMTLCVTLEVPEPKELTPVGIDLGVNNALVASTESSTLFVTGSKLRTANTKTRKTRRRLQQKLSDHKAKHRNTRSVVRVLKRLGRKQRNRNASFCKETAAKLCKWAPKDSILVFEDLLFKQVRKDRRMRKGTRRKLSAWFYRQMTEACVHKAQRMGLGVKYIDPFETSKRCRKCGSLGVRRGNRFSCECGHVEHADVNASHNIRSKFTVLRGSGRQSIRPEAVV